MRGVSPDRPLVIGNHWQKFINEAEAPHGVTTEDDCIRALREAADRLGRSPSKAEYEDLGLTPSSATIQRVMGGWNAAKMAAALETYRSTGSRTEPKPADTTIPETCSWDELTADQRWHYRNVEWNTTRTRLRRAELRAWVNGIKAEQGCERCEETDPACLEFHHTNEDEKEWEIGRMVTHGYRKDRIQAEVAKCEVLCANCHRKEHHEDPRAVDSGEESA